jgi:hypothetical protein
MDPSMECYAQQHSLRCTADHIAQGRCICCLFAIQRQSLLLLMRQRMNSLALLLALCALALRPTAAGSALSSVETADTTATPGYSNARPLVNRTGTSTTAELKGKSTRYKRNAVGRRERVPLWLLAQLRCLNLRDRTDYGRLLTCGLTVCGPLTLIGPCCPHIASLFVRFAAVVSDEQRRCGGKARPAFRQSGHLLTTRHGGSVDSGGWGSFLHVYNGLADAQETSALARTGSCSPDCMC